MKKKYLLLSLVAIILVTGCGKEPEKVVSLNDVKSAPFDACETTTIESGVKNILEDIKWKSSRGDNDTYEYIAKGKYDYDDVELTFTFSNGKISLKEYKYEDKEQSSKSIDNMKEAICGNTSKLTPSAAKEKTTESSNTNDNEDSNMVNIYVFYGDGCPHCASLHDYLAELKADKEYKNLFNVVDFEVWGNSANVDIMNDVADHFDITVDGVPFYVIGDKYYSGFGDSSKDTIKERIKECANDSDYEDVVKGIID